jgi:hypothetical protein
MRSHHRLSHLSLPARSRRAALALMLATAVILAGCGRGADPSDIPAGVPAAEPGQPIDVVGRAAFIFTDLSTSGTLVFPAGSPGDLPVQADETATRASAEAIRAWLDTVLGERNRGLTTTIGLSAVDAAAVGRALGTDGPMTDGVLDVQVASATYLIEVAYLGKPGWALARVESVLVASAAPTVETGRRLDSFVFTIDETGAVEFVALEVAP